MPEDNRSRLIAEVAAKLQIRLDEDDPAFVLVELNRMILDQSIRKALGEIRNEFSQVPRSALDAPAIEALAVAVAKEIAPSGQKEQRSPHYSSNAPTPRSRTHWSTKLGIVLAILLAGFVAGWVTARVLA